MQTLDNKRVRQLLLQATMGFNTNDVNRALDSGSIETWIQNQISTGRSSLVSFQEKIQAAHSQPDRGSMHFKLGYTDMLMNRNDILRHRITYILTQLFVVSVKAPGLSSNSRRIAFAKYYDNLARACFGSFRELLKVMATSPVMGHYLTYLNNDAVAGVAPDENFARELMQLFSIGPALMRMDGTIVTEDGRPVLSYTQEDIEEGARVMTGWGLHDDRWDVPMREKDGAHDLKAKTILGHDFPAGAVAEQDLDQFLDVLCQHENIAPFIAKFFIQKMVSSNPSPDYVYRVATAFRDSDLDMVSMINAILTDPEADYSRNEEHDGLMRDPIILLSHVFRALRIKLKPGQEILPNSFTWYDRRFIFEAPSVFYHYQPDEAPNDGRFDGITAPAFKLYNWDDIHLYYRQITLLGVVLESQNSEYYMDRDGIIKHFFETENDEKLIDELDRVIFAYTMTDAMKQVIHQYLGYAKRNNAHLRALIIQLLMSPQFTTQG